MRAYRVQVPSFPPRRLPKRYHTPRLFWWRPCLSFSRCSHARWRLLSSSSPAPFSMPRRLSCTATSTCGMFGIPTHYGYSWSHGWISAFSRTPCASLRGGRSAQTRADLIPRVLAQMDNLCSHSQTNVGLLRFPLLLETTMTRPFSHHFPPHIRVLDIFLPEATRSLPMPPLSPLPPTPTPTQNMFPQKADTLLPNLAILLGPSLLLILLAPSYPLIGASITILKPIYAGFRPTSPLQLLPLFVHHLRVETP